MTKSVKLRLCLCMTVEGMAIVSKNKMKFSDKLEPDSTPDEVMALVERAEPVRELGVLAKPKKKPLEKPNYNPEAVSLRIFVTACGKAYNQTAGFQSYANRMGLKPRPMAAWREEFDKFLNRPVNGG